MGSFFPWILEDLSFASQRYKSLKKGNKMSRWRVSSTQHPRKLSKGTAQRYQGRGSVAWREGLGLACMSGHASVQCPVLSPLRSCSNT